MKRVLLITACVACLASPVKAQSNQEMLQYLVQQDLQRQQQAQQPQPMTGLNEQQWEACMHNAYVAGQLAPKHTGNTWAEGNAQALQYEQACGPRP